MAGLMAAHWVVSMADQSAASTADLTAVLMAVLMADQWAALMVGSMAAPLADLTARSTVVE
jgi:hypothetical protein